MKKILIIDSSALIHHKYALVLRRYQCDMVTARNGSDGIIRLADHPDIDLVLLDMLLPDMDGIDILLAVKALKRYAHIPIILLTTEGQEDDAREGLALGAKGVVKKNDGPASLHALIEALAVVRPCSREARLSDEEASVPAHRSGYGLAL